MKLRRTIIWTLALASFGGLLFSCQEGANNSSLSTKTLSLNESDYQLVFGDQFELIATYEKVQGTTLTWKSENEAVVTVTEGSVFAVGIGETDVVAQYGNAVARCHFRVSYSDYVPTLRLDGISDSSLSLGVGSSYPLTGKAYFNHSYYPCSIDATSSDPAVVSIEEGTLKAKKVGNATLQIKGNWNGFEGPLMEQELQVTVKDNVALFARIHYGNRTEISDTIHLSLVDSWQGETYDSSATIEVGIEKNGVSQNGGEILMEENDVVALENNVISAKGVGESKIVLHYAADDGSDYETTLTVTVTCPVATYEEELKFSTQAAFPLTKIFGEGASILSASQGNKKLSIRKGKYIEGVEAKGENTESMVVLTTKGGYYFPHVFAYTLALNESNIVSTLTLSSGKVVSGYYLLESDILTPVDFSEQISSYYIKNSEKNTFFAGVFDGQGHTLAAKVGKNGIFGGLGNGAMIKNTHFEFTFLSSSQTAVGLASNAYTFYQSDWVATLLNLYVTTTSFDKNCHALMDFRFNHLVMQNVYVVLTGADKLPTYQAATQQYGALFRIDANGIYGPFGAYVGDFRNVYVVTSQFMPLAGGNWMQDPSGRDLVYVSYAKNDEARLGSLDHLAAQDSYAYYCFVTPKTGNEHLDYFGYIYSEDNWIPSTIAWIYTARSDIAGGGISRYDTAKELRTSGITQVGSWEVL